MPDDIETNVGDAAPPFLDNLAKEAPVKVEISDKDKEEFFKAFLADGPYKETVTVFDGKLSLTFTTLTVEENNDIFNQIILDQEKGLAKNHDSYFIKMALYRLGVSLVEINHQVFAKGYTKIECGVHDGQSYVKGRSELFDKWPVYKLSVVMEAFKRFDTKVQQLSIATLDPTFWKAAA